MGAWLRAALLVLTLLLALGLGAPLLWLLSACGLRVEGAFQRLFCRATLACLRLRVHVEGAGDVEPRLLVANHVSWIDILALGSVEPLCFLAKREVGAWPVIATFARLQGTVFVDRARRRSIPGANRAMADRLAAGRSVLLFPQGTTEAAAMMGRFHTSHLACLRDRFRGEPRLGAGVVQPVALDYSDPVAAWIGDDTLLPHLWAVLNRPPITCHLRFGTPVTVRPGYDRKALGRLLAARIEGALAPPRPTIW